LASSDFFIVGPSVPLQQHWDAAHALLQQQWCAAHALQQHWDAVHALQQQHWAAAHALQYWEPEPLQHWGQDAQQPANDHEEQQQQLQQQQLVQQWLPAERSS
jgi:hypothetical protein